MIYNVLFEVTIHFKIRIMLSKNEIYTEVNGDNEINSIPFSLSENVII